MKKVLINMNWETSAVTEMNLYIKMLEDAGFIPVIDPRIRPLNKDELLESLQGCYAYIGSVPPFTAEVLKICSPTLKIISRTGVGYDNIDIQAATELGIVVTNTPGVHAEAVSEYAMAMMLAVARRVVEVNNAAKNGNWVRFPGPTLWHKKLGIIGTGNIGKKFAEISRGFCMKILAYDQYPDLNFAKRLNLQYCDTIKELLPQIDFLTIHTPLTKDTTNLIDAKCLALMKPQAIIVNCARGGIVNEQALYEALKNNKIAGAGLDVFTEEPVDPNNPLLSLDNFISGTHNAGTSLEGKNNVVKSAVQSVIDYHAGERPFGIINPEVLTLKN